MRVRMITEGNYPSVIGGVTRWCDRLLVGLAEVDWSVLALGVRPSPGRVPSARIDFCVPVDPTRHLPASRTAPSSAGRELVVELAGQLFAAEADPARLQGSLVRARLELDERDVVPAVHVAAEELAVQLGVRSEMSFLVTAREMLHEVIAIARHQAPEVDLNLSACVGRAAVPALIDAALSGTPALVIEHGIYVDEAFLATAAPTVDRGTRWLVRQSALNLAAAAYQVAEQVIGVSEANRRRSIALGALPGRTTVIPNGVELPSPGPTGSGRSDRNPVVGMVGRVDPLKGVDRFIEVAAAVVGEIPDASFVQIGPEESAHGPYAERCHRMVDEFGLGERFSFAGSHPDPPALLEGIDVIVVPSRSEGMPFALLEAMAAGRPVVAAGVGGVAETLGDSGIVVDAQDLAAMSDAVVALLRDRSAAARLGASAREAVAERFELNLMLDRYRALLERPALERPVLERPLLERPARGTGVAA